MMVIIMIGKKLCGWCLAYRTTDYPSLDWVRKKLGGAGGEGGGEIGW